MPVDSSSFTVRFAVADKSSDTLRPVRRLDVFAYDADGLHSLILSRRYGFLPDSLLFYGPVTGMTVVAVANSPMDFNTSALDRYESIELLSYRFEDDSPQVPLMSGVGSVGADMSTVVTLTPMLARVMLGEVCNELKGYVRLEDPRITLESMNASAEILRTNGFYPSETVPEPPVARLPFDIGSAACMVSIIREAMPFMKMDRTSLMAEAEPASPPRPAPQLHHACRHYHHRVRNAGEQSVLGNLTQYHDARKRGQKAYRLIISMLALHLWEILPEVGK